MFVLLCSGIGDTSPASSQGLYRESGTADHPIHIEDHPDHNKSRGSPGGVQGELWLKPWLKAWFHHRGLTSQILFCMALICSLANIHRCFGPTLARFPGRGTYPLMLHPVSKLIEAGALPEFSFNEAPLLLRLFGYLWTTWKGLEVQTRSIYGFLWLNGLLSISMINLTINETETSNTCSTQRHGWIRFLMISPNISPQPFPFFAGEHVTTFDGLPPLPPRRRTVCSEALGWGLGDGPVRHQLFAEFANLRVDPL